MTIMHADRRTAPQAMHKRTKRSLIVGAVVLIVLAFAAYGVYEFGRNDQWWGETDAVRTLKADPMAATDLLGLELAHAEQPEPAGFLRKSNPPIINRWFSLKNKDSEEVQRQTIELAEKHGWVNDASSSTDEYWNGTKRDYQGNIISINIQSEKSNDRTGSELNVRLRYK